MSVSAFEPVDNAGDRSVGAESSGEERFEPFDLTVNLGPDAIPWLSAASRAGSLHGIPRGTAILPRLPDLLDLVFDFTDAIRFAEPQPNPELSRLLGEIVFGDPMVLQLFQATRGVAADRGRQLLLRILASPHLAVLPWELLPDPAAVNSGREHSYLALAPDTQLVRLARGRTYPARTTLLEAPLNLLIVLSSPTPQDEKEEWLAFDIFEVKRSLLAELAPLVQAGMLNIDVEDRPTLDNLRRRIGAQRRGYHLFHYVGHATPDRLILEDRAGRREDLASSQFMEVLRLCPDLRLAVFAGCETARAAGDPALHDPSKAGWRDLLSLADYCVQEACPTVIGMQAVLPFSTERVFTRFFYQAVANGYSIAEALRLARGAIRGDERLGGAGGDLLDWSVPALFVGSSAPGPLVPRSAPSRKLAQPMRWDLNLGLRQTNETFFARELPLRQAVDVLAGLTPERILVVTGATGVGKTSLVDRALEELGEVITHVLYVHFDRLAPVVAKACDLLAEGKMPDLGELTDLALAPDHALERLCYLTNELLGRGGRTTRARDAAWNVVEWWERVVEDLVQQRFVLAIDEIGLLDRAQRGLLEKLVKQWLADHANTDLEALLSHLQESQERNASAPQTEQAKAQMEALPAELRAYLSDLSERLVVKSHQVLSDTLEILLATQKSAPDRQPLRKTKRGAKAASDAVDVSDPVSLTMALMALDAVRKSLGRALQILADRRSPARIVITAVDKPQFFVDLPENLVFEMRLAQLTWSETWRWIRRNLPGLVSYGEVYLSRLWTRLGARLDRWEELERRVLRSHSAAVDLQEITAEIAPPAPARSPVDRRSLLPARRGHRPLRIAVAGPFLAGPSELAESITQLAIDHGIGGRVVPSIAEAGALATLIDEPSPFQKTKGAMLSDILQWLDRVRAKQPDIILLDYGVLTPVEETTKSDNMPIQRSFLRILHYSSLLIAAGGNAGASEMVTTPSAYPEVLSVGSLDDDGVLRPEAEWHPQLVKPDLFMADNLSATPLATALKPELLSREIQGSGFAALHAVATAALTWSFLPELSPRAVRALLVDASKPIVKTKLARSLTIADAVALARKRVVERTLRDGAASLHTLGAITGLEVRVLSSTLDALIKQHRVVKLASGRLERYQLL
jgi:hypothetical protein